MIGILDYGCGNTNSVIRMIQKLGGLASKVSDAQDIAAVDRLIIPGVGAFDHGMQQLHDRGLLPALEQFALQDKKPVLGICLGMQLLCRASEEGSLPGLGWIDAQVRRFQSTLERPLKIPHMGWSEIDIAKANPLLQEGECRHRFYFVHAYKVEAACALDILATADYGGAFVAAFQRENVMGVQFHPEKSHQFGFGLMKNFMTEAA